MMNSPSTSKFESGVLYCCFDYENTLDMCEEMLSYDWFYRIDIRSLSNNLFVNYSYELQKRTEESYQAGSTNPIPWGKREQRRGCKDQRTSGCYLGKGKRSKRRNVNRFDANLVSSRIDLVAVVTAWEIIMLKYLS